MKYQKYITVMQMAMGVTASNKDIIPPKRMLWVPPDIPGATGPAIVSVSGAAGAATLVPSSAISTLSLSQSNKPSLRRIKGRIHRSKSLDSIDLLDCNRPQVVRGWQQYLKQHHTEHRAPRLRAQSAALHPADDDCTATYSNNHIVKFADDTTLVGLITKGLL
ncbi:hypothetical protein AALO_G00268920 [Alosa alosa]|uniref:Uncharacterized protein n=1 Tax=Alosa alosa TaxID=278164 RepID=A0AAV6FMV0_9TELE|nr:hypothetical protein AALO_G00268920 [Alosa alosa]